MEPTVFFDMDGVLADFVSGALRHHNREDVCPWQIEWSIEDQLGIEPAAFWSPLGFDFWANLEPYTDGFGLLAIALEIVGEARIGLLTSPCDTAGCVDGKRAWVAKHLPAFKRRLFVGSAKELFASPSKVLIDDHDANCARFATAGGRVVTPPRPWNRRKNECGSRGYFDAVAISRELELAVAGARHHGR